MVLVDYIGICLQVARLLSPYCISWSLASGIFLLRWIKHDLVKLLTWNLVVWF